MKRLWYEIRWWRWFLFDGTWPIHTLYGGPYRLDKDSRRLIIERCEREHEAREPQFNGTYPNRRRRVNE